MSFPNEGRVPVAGLQHRLLRLRRHDDDRRGASGQGRLELILQVRGGRDVDHMARTVDASVIYVNAPMPVMARPTMSVCIVSVPSKVWIASRSTMCRMTW
jgi:hypothetical protein